MQFPQVRGWSDADPVMRGLRGWHELEIAEAYRFPNLPPKTPRLVEGDQDLLLMFTLSRQAYKDLVLAFPLSTDDAKWNTRWFLKPLFPLFLRNVLYALGNVRDATTEETVRPGQIPRSLGPFGDVKEVKVRTPSGSSTNSGARYAGRVLLRRDGRAGHLRGDLGGPDAALRGQPVRRERKPHRAAAVGQDRRDRSRGRPDPQAAARTVALGRCGWVGAFVA